MFKRLFESFKVRLFVVFLLNIIIGFVLSYFARNFIYSANIVNKSDKTDLFIYSILMLCFCSILFFFFIHFAILSIKKLIKQAADLVKKDPNQQIDISIFPEINELVQTIRKYAFSVEKEKQLSVEIKKAAAQRAVLAEYDQMTGLYNKKYLFTMLPQEISRAKILSDNVSLLMIDIDYFKDYNDTMGHIEGDKALKKVSEILKESTRNMDICVRYGGEEFTVILPKTDSEKAVSAAERIRHSIETYNFPGAEKLPQKKVTVSVGVATFPHNAATAEELIIKADTVLYKAKNTGKNKVVVYNENESNNDIEDLEKTE